MNSGTTLRDFENVSTMDNGGMVKVGRARDTKLGPAVVIQTLHEEFAFDSGRRARFERKAKLPSSLNSMQRMLQTRNLHMLMVFHTRLRKLVMKRRRLFTHIAPAMLLLTVFIPTASSHHSTAIYDSENPIELSGTVVEWRFTNPHVIIMLEVTHEGGNTELWSVEGSNTSLLFRRGWTPTTLKAGDRITVRVRPLRSGVPGGNYSNPRWEDGTPILPRSDR